MSASFVIEVYNVPPGPDPELPVETPPEDPIACPRATLTVRFTVASLTTPIIATR